MRTAHCVGPQPVVLFENVLGDVASRACTRTKSVTAGPKGTSPSKRQAPRTREAHMHTHAPWQVILATPKRGNLYAGLCCRPMMIE
eukprot:6199112-Pleurochrysis_carterae.AAC.5